MTPGQLQADLRADLLRLSTPGTPRHDIRWNSRRVLVRLLSEPGAWAVVEYRLRRYVSAMPGGRVIAWFSKKVPWLLICGVVWRAG
jgi:hypothetical protein